MKDNKKSTRKNPPEEVIQCGEVFACVRRSQSNTGYQYLLFSLTRSWTSQATGKAQSGSSFFDYNEADLVEAVRQACRWIRRQNSQDCERGESPVPQDGSE